MEFTTHFELQSQATRLVGSGPYRRRDCGTNGTATLLGALFKSDLAAALPAGDHAPLAYNSTTLRVPDFKHELFPLHSPLLRESWLVSFPPLSYMLKFSGSSCLIRGGSISSSSSISASLDTSSHNRVIIIVIMRIFPCMYVYMLSSPVRRHPPLD